VGPGAVHTIDRSGSVHNSVAGSLTPHKITFQLNITSHFLLLKRTLHPALHSKHMLMRDATLSEGTMCPVETVGSPGILIAYVHRHNWCAIWKITCERFCRDLFVYHVDTVKMKMNVVPVSAIAWFAAIVIAFKYCGKGLPKIWRAVAASDRGAWRVECFKGM
jgi:hypothetical protein